MESLRQRNRINAMRTTQRCALPMFVERGFDNVTVGEIAAQAGMAPSTLYRHFHTKEDIVIWDEHEAAIDTALAKALTDLPAFEAIRRVFLDELAARYDDDLDFQLTRIRYIYQTEQLHAAAVEAELAARTELTTALEKILKSKNRPAAAMISGAAMLAVDIAFDRWQADRAERSLAERIDEAFDQLARVAEFD